MNAEHSHEQPQEKLADARQLTLAEERAESRKRMDKQFADALKRCRTPESYVEFQEAFRCGKYAPRLSWGGGR